MNANGCLLWGNRETFLRSLSEVNGVKEFKTKPQLTRYLHLSLVFPSCHFCLGLCIREIIALVSGRCYPSFPSGHRVLPRRKQTTKKFTCNRTSFRYLFNAHSTALVRVPSLVVSRLENAVASPCVLYTRLRGARQLQRNVAQAGGYIRPYLYMLRICPVVCRTQFRAQLCMWSNHRRSSSEFAPTSSVTNAKSVLSLAYRRLYCYRFSGLFENKHVFAAMHLVPVAGVVITPRLLLDSTTCRCITSMRRLEL